MGYYDNNANVEHYIRMSAECDGRMIVNGLRRYLPDGSRVLELGMGPGKDTLLLDQHYQVIGSDSSVLFIKRFRKLHPNIRVEMLDAVTMETDARYQGIYSNKVLYHLTRDELRASFDRQARVLMGGGIALHSFWHGDEEGEYQGLRFAYYSEETLKALIGPEYDILEARQYTEIESDDSFYIVLRRR